VSEGKNWRLHRENGASGEGSEIGFEKGRQNEKKKEKASILTQAETALSSFSVVLKK